MRVSSHMVITGAGGHARILIETVRSEGRWIVAALTDPAVKGEVLGVTVEGADDVLPLLRERGVSAALVGVGSVGKPTRRVRLFQRLTELGFTLPSVCNHRAHVSPTVTLGDGSVVFAGAVVNSQAEIGRNVIINSGSIVEHDCRIADHVHVAPGAVLGGAVTIEPEVHIGMGAVVLQGRTIGRGTVIGAGAVVLRDMPPNSLCVGVPAVPIRQLDDDDETEV
ncbi:MAG: acetyltransferase [Phycisphaerae bacterium]|nr:acetyltransferase [Phycisphaerae bacterium]